MVTQDKNERSKQRRLRENRARKVLVSVSILSLLGGTATIYAANPPGFTSDEPTNPSLLNEPDPTATTGSSQPAPANDGTRVDDDEPTSGVTFPNVTVPSSKSSWDDDDDDDEDDEYDDEYDDEEDEDEEYEPAATATATAPATEAADPTETTALEPTPTTEIVVPQRPSNSRSSSSR